MIAVTCAVEGMTDEPVVRRLLSEAGLTVEAWLLADYEGFKRYFKVGTRLRGDVDRLEDPKTELVNFCRRSNSRDVKSGVPPQPGSGRRVGPEYVAIVGEYCREVWNPDRARHRSPSLDRAMTDIDRLGGWIRGLEPVS